ncbi:Uncharacterised protein [Vibrio cholerae]|uniref:Uncharacterized protein n=1 Tax=Vibrio cholerae TaxID=666 RepID=A0A655QB74_VIBCL|nr:Uncharacterised protein [Vibrio cholerae]CSA66750.1 Uncharacterised protein [Vibrio cholerae]CSC24700.1 Uncharacterised protein [Vibrio cholerae]
MPEYRDQYAQPKIPHQNLRSESAERESDHQTHAVEGETAYGCRGNRHRTVSLHAYVWANCTAASAQLAPPNRCKEWRSHAL